MRTLTALVLATAMLFTVAGAQAAKKHHRRHATQTKKEAPAKPEAKTPEKK